MRRNLGRFAGSLGVACILATGWAGSTAGARGPVAPVTMTGTITCPVTVGLHLSSPISNGPTTAPITLTIVTAMHGCTNVVQDGVRLTSGHVATFSVPLPAGLSCTSVAGMSTPPDLSGLPGGTVKWAPVAHIAPSTDVSLTGFSASITSAGLVQVSASGSVSGSFASSDASLTLTSNTSVSTLMSQCGRMGVKNLVFAGSVTL
jgi:hypothetical protein